MFTWNQCLSHNAITNYVNSLKYKLRQNSRTQITSKVSNTNYVNYVKSLKHKLRQQFQIQTTSKLSNTNYVKSLKYKLRQKSQTQLRQKPQAQTKHLTLYTVAEQLTGCKVHIVK